ncbi:hypothetical protein U9M48_012184 [Paspalum notatum var. saurae]|uniref:BHLH domain-containing protein n=1 Tax=Paspalum notatum var. saurae TaxID=547442 RepID=A0AAQ3SWZ3_PASNO
MAGGEAAVRRALQSVAESTGWTYSILWHLCPRQGALVWAEGHYNGAVKTRKTTAVHPGGGEDGQEEATASGAARRRSRQLRELYDSLAAAEDEAVAAPRRPSAAALAPEDLSEAEWFYLVCASYSFPPAVGLPGQAFARRGHVWLCGANKVDSKVFSRAILARTVACIPVDDGVLEIGTTEEVEEDIGLIQYARNIFMDQHGTTIVPTISGHSTSTPTTHINHRHHPFQQTKVENHILQPHNNADPTEGNRIGMEDDDEDRIDSETNNTENDPCQHHHQPLPLMDNVGNEQATLDAGSSELMRFQMSEMVRGGCSNQVDEEIPMLMVDEVVGQWNFHYQDLTGSSEFLQPSGGQDQDEDEAVVLPEHAHYVKTVVAILRHNACRQAQAAATTSTTVKTYRQAALSKNSPFSRWSRNDDVHGVLITHGGTPQRMLKSVLLGAPSRRRRHCGDDRGGGDAHQSPEPRTDDGEGTSSSRSRRGQQVHVLKERRRREKLNQRFVVLRSLVPFVTKMDRASILGDTIEYVKQLRRRIQELESPSPAAPARQPVDGGVGGGGSSTIPTTAAPAAACSTLQEGGQGHHRTARGGGGGGAEVQVSIIESDALVELQCPHREGLLLRVMQALHRDLRLEVTSVQASSAGDALVVELRAKVKEVNGRRSSITEVKRAIHHLIVSESD